MTIDDLIKHFDGLIDKLETGLVTVTETAAMDLMAIIVNRIQQEGLPGKKYSKNKLPKFFFHDSGTVAAQKALNRKEFKDGVSYEEWRKLNGLQVAHVDLTFTGRMFQNLAIIETIVADGNYLTIIGGIDKEVKDKLRWNAERFGNFLTLTPEEKEEFSKIMEESKKRILKEFFA